jgi:hypothetical protein
MCVCGGGALSRDLLHDLWTYTVLTLSQCYDSDGAERGPYTRATPSGLSGLRASMNSTTTARSQPLRCCSLSSTVMVFPLLCLRRTLLFHSQLANTFVTTLL